MHMLVRIRRLDFRVRLGIILGLLVVAIAVVYSPLFEDFVVQKGQDVSYHRFADERTLLGMPNCLNVVSNVPFVFIGVWGLWWIGQNGATSAAAFRDPSERWPFVVLFFGVMLTGFGSSYYHWRPDNDRLVWDRLPMSIAFMSFFASTIAERINLKAGFWLLLPLVALGVGSVWYWHWTELRGAGDLRLYGLVQFYPLTVIPIMLILFPSRYTGTAYIWGTLGWYVLAKILEIQAVDHGIMALGQVISGHSLKHLAAAVGAYWVLRFLKARRELP